MLAAITSLQHIMAFFVWNERYSVKIARMDEQHKTLFSLFDELANAMLSGTAREAYGRILRGLSEYAKTHFTQEEQLMKQHGYPGYDGHKKLHEEFIKQIDAFRKDFEAGAALPIKTSVFLRDWLTNHILKVDQQYSAFLNANGVR